MTNRIATAAVAALIVGLALHNAAMAALWRAGLRDGPLTVVSAWKEALLLLALGVVAWRTLRERRLPFAPNVVDALAAAFALLALLYAVLPQGWLEGQADNRAIAYGLRSALVPVGAWFLGRSVEAEGESPESIDEERRLCYVGVTRAKDSLTLTRAQFRKKWGKLRETTPSRFLHEMFDEAPVPAADDSDVVNDEV